MGCNAPACDEVRLHLEARTCALFSGFCGACAPFPLNVRPAGHRPAYGLTVVLREGTDGSGRQTGQSASFLCERERHILSKVQAMGWSASSYTRHRVLPNTGNLRDRTQSDSSWGVRHLSTAARGARPLKALRACSTEIDGILAVHVGGPLRSRRPTDCRPGHEHEPCVAVCGLLPGGEYLRFLQ